MTSSPKSVEASFEAGGWPVIERIIADQNRWPTDEFFGVGDVDPGRTKDNLRRTKYRARCGFKQAGDNSQQRRLSRAGRTNDARKLAK